MLRITKIDDRVVNLSDTILPGTRQELLEIVADRLRAVLVQNEGLYI